MAIIYQCDICGKDVGGRMSLYKVSLINVATKMRERAWEVCGPCSDYVQDAIDRLAAVHARQNAPLREGE